MASCTEFLLHINCRNTPYPREPSIVRANVPDDKVSWDVDWPEYKPVSYEHPKLLKASYADKDVRVDKSVKYNYNHMDGKVDRSSFLGTYKLDQQRLPLNPCGRTGITGRGVLGYWGPNHAGDPVVTRWKRNEAGDKLMHPISGKPIVQFVSIQRKDTKEWALPGGMVDAGEHISTTVKREFAEEALDSTTMSEEEKKNVKQMVDDNFKDGVQLYAGYCDDSRNTDNAWMETVALHYHDETGNTFGRFALTSGDDAQAVRWVDADSSLKLYASHLMILQKAIERLNGHW